MLLFRSLLLVLIGTVLAYTGVVGAAHGWNFGPVFINDIRAMTWSGQFNLDFGCFVLLSMVWVAWRHQFSAGGFALAMAFLMGTSVVATYLLVASFQAKGDAAVLLLGRKRAQ